MLQSDFYLENIVDDDNDDDNVIPFAMIDNPMFKSSKKNDEMLKSSSFTNSTVSKEIMITPNRNSPKKLPHNIQDNYNNTNIINNSNQISLNSNVIINDTNNNINETTGNNVLKKKIKHSFYTLDLDDNDTIIEKEIQIISTNNNKEEIFSDNINNSETRIYQKLSKNQSNNKIVNENNNIISTSKLSTLINHNIKKVALKPLHISNNYQISNMNNSNANNKKNSSKYCNIYSDENNIYANTRKSIISKSKEINNKTRNYKIIR